MTHKTLIVIIGITLAASLPMPAQESGRPAREQARERVQKLRERLRLTPEQVGRLDVRVRRAHK